MTGLRSLLLATGLGLTACRSTPPPPPVTSPSAAPSPRTPEATAPPPERYVLLHERARLASGLDDTAETARALDPSEAGSVHALVWLVRLVDRHGPWLEVETVETDSDGPHCAPTLTALDGYRLRLFVRADDVAPVVRREVTVELPNGNRVTLGPGMPVTLPKRSGDPVRVHTRPELSLPVPTDAIGRDYAEPRHYDTGEPVASLKARPLRLTEDVPLPERLGWAVYDRREDGDTTVATLAHECMRYELRVPDAQLAPFEPYGVGGLGGHLPGSPRYRIAADAPVYWTNGERAGATRRAVMRFDEPTRREIGRVCFKHRLTSGSRSRSQEPEFVLCFDDVDVEPAPSAVDPARPSAPG